MLLLFPVVAVLCVGGTHGFVVHHVTPSRVPVEGGVTVTVVGEGFLNAPIPTCRIDPPHGSSIHIMRGENPNAYSASTDWVSFPATVHNATFITCQPPQVTAGGPGLFTISPDNTTWPSYGSGSPVTYYSSVEVTIGRRPYLTETAGELLLHFDHRLQGEEVEVTARLATVNLSWSITAAHETTVSFPLDLFPTTVNNDMEIAVHLAGRPAPLRFLRRFMRYPPPPRSIRAVQVDHKRSVFLVNGEPRVFNGWFVDPGQNLSQFVTQWIPQMQANGLTVAMIGSLPFLNTTTKRWILDACEEAGLLVVYPPFSGNVSFMGGGPFNDPALLAPLVADIRSVMDHPAVVGYYICDDCCHVSTTNISLQAQGYNVVKGVDPYHAVFGANGPCDSTWLWSDTPSHHPPAAKLSEWVVPDGVQPHTQLGLDIVLEENYKGELGLMASSGEWPYQGSWRVGDLRHGSAFEVLGVCLEPMQFHSYGAYRVRSALWLGVVTARLYYSLQWIWMPGEYFTTYSQPIGRFTRELQALIDPVTSAPATNLTFPVHNPSFPFPYGTLRGKAYAAEGYTIAVVVNLWHEKAINFTVEVAGGANGTARRIFDPYCRGNCTFPIVHGVFADTVIGGDTNIYNVTSQE